MIFNNRWKIIIIASFLAWLMEYSLRGIGVLTRLPQMAVLIFFNYFFYLVLIEDFIGRFKLKDCQVWLIAEVFALLWQLVGVAGIYYPPYILGINLGVLFINNVIWWPTLQTIFALYIARTLVTDIDRSKPLLSKEMILIFFTVYLLISASFRLLATPPVKLYQTMLVIILITIFGFLSYKEILFNIRNGVTQGVFQKSKFLNILAVFMGGYLTFSFFFLAGGGLSLINPRALRVNIVISPLIALILLIYRLKTKKPIPL